MAKVYLGIDQTGAVKPNGAPRPLPACLIKGSEVHFFFLPSLSHEHILKNARDCKIQDIRICIDCVLGLPKALEASWDEVLKQTLQKEGYGLKVASQFFRELGKGLIHRREVEILCQANSVFKEKPFQKNIQTGTFRIWKDLARSRKEFYVPALEQQRSRNQIPLYEGYPSLSWKLLLGQKRRSPNQLSQIVESSSLKLRWTPSHQSLVSKDPNFADAFVLALTMRKFNGTKRAQVVHEEGWILGFPQ